MSTKKLAKKLGLVRQRKKHVSASKKVISNQIFSYLIVIDFESTCWREKNTSSQEIIEFPAVLLNTSTGDIDSEFHTFVQPQEHPTLSEFCTELTGITQVQVEAGLPLQICLSRFTRWLQSLQLEMGFTFPNKQQGSSSSLSTQKLCTFLTWSDWDLGVCLQYECKRKQLHKPDVFNNWIDLRSTYRLWYNRKPKGLNGALQDLGLQFDGREHSGLDDARNTARLAAKMMRDGCVMKITRSLDRTPVVVKGVTGNATRLTNNTKEKLTVSKNETGPSTSKPLCAKLCQQQTFLKKKSESSVVAAGSDSLSVQKFESLISPKTLLNVPAAALWGHTHTPGTGARLSAPMNLHSTHNSSSHVLCSTTISCLTDGPQVNQPSSTVSADDVEDVELLVDLEERCGSYDDVVLECGGNEVDDDTEVLDVDTGIYDEEESDNSHSSRNCAIVEVKLKERGAVVQKNLQNILQNSVTCENNIFTSTSKKEMTNLLKSNHCFAVPKPVRWGKQNQCKTGPAPKMQGKFDDSHKDKMTDVVGTSCVISQNIFSPNVLSSKPKPAITKPVRPLSSPFIIYSEPEKRTAASFPSRASSGSLHTPNNVLTTLSTNSFSRVNNSRVSGTTRGQKVTSPLCACGRRAKRQVVSNGGPNHGRGFYCCPVRRSGGKGKMEKRCEFFKWESALMQTSSGGAAVFRSSVSFCQTNSSLSHYQPHRAQLRKSC
ncbi:ERI1 exoribonuclease 2 [Oryzias latipes]|uniref:ERI1 exoribonuclease 2 n=1 Tax=Oryzias latipes TaxID=8090 RepID=A0A3B3HDH0_ORYLA|nr:ERI1 exoribonuclease 2 [Oryzias latipes]